MDEMLWCLVVAVVVAAVSGQGVRYDGTPSAGNFVNGPGGASGSNQPVVIIVPQSHNVPQGVSQGSFPQGGISGAAPGFPHGAFPVVQQGFPQVGVPAVAPAASQGLSIRFPQSLVGPAPVVMPILPQQQFVPMVSPPVLPQPQPVLPIPRGPLPCHFSAGTLVHVASDTRREYHFSWCAVPGHTFSHDQAKQYCHHLPSDGHPVGFRLLSIEDEAEDNFITSILSAYQVPYIWTSGERVGSYEFRWHRSITLQYTHWSHTGSLGRSQPDNADGDENCLAVLNNVYMDGIVWHDVGCSFEKYVICERPRAYGS